MVFGSKKRKVDEVEAELEEIKQELAKANKEIATKRDELTKLETERTNLSEKNEARNKEVAKLEEQQKKLQKEKKELEKDKTDNKAELEKLTKKMDTLQTDITKEKKRLKETQEKAKDDIQERDGKINDLETQKKELEELRDELQEKKAELQNTVATKSRIIQLQENDANSSKFFVDVSLDSFEFAKAFPYFITLQLGNDFAPRKTETSGSSQYPHFENSNFLLPFHNEDTESQLILRVYVVVNPNDPTPSTKKLGEAVISIEELGATKSEKSDPLLMELRQKTIVKNCNFLRKKSGRESSMSPMGGGRISGGRDDPDHILVGKCVVRIEKKLMKPSEQIKLEDSRPQLGNVPSASINAPEEREEKNDPLLQKSLDHSLWMVQPFQHRLRILWHCVKDLFYRSNFQTGGSSGSTSCPNLLITVRTLRFDGSISYEVNSSDIPLQMDRFGNADVLEYLHINQELVVPLKLPGSSSLRDQRCQISMCVIEASAIREVFSQSFFLNVIPAFDPITVNCVCRNRDPQNLALCFTMTREIELPDIADSYHGVEMRLHGVPFSRPLPEMVNNALLVIAPDFPHSSNSTALPQPRLPILKFEYDAQRDLTSMLEAYYTDNLATFPRMPKFFLSPVAQQRSRAPGFEQAVLRFAASPRNIESITIFMFEKSLLRSDPHAIVPDFLLGFSSVDCTTLAPPDGSREPLSRSYMLDLRLLESPQQPCSLEVDVRVWGKGIRAEHLTTDSVSSPGTRKHLTDPTSPAAAAQGVLANGHLMQQNGQMLQQEFRLNQDLSIQLMKEFNLRASALKSAGQEIVELKRLTQLLQNENSKLKNQIEEEQKFSEEIRLKHPPNTELLDSLSTQELALKLQTTLSRYRDEKQKVSDLKIRMESAMREIAKNRGLEKQLEELEKVHLEQATLLQKYQKDQKKIGLYRETARSQEKVIAKLEKVLENSLEDLHKAQQTSITLEKVMHENAELKRHHADLTRKVTAFASKEDVGELKKQVRAKDLELEKLTEICSQLKKQQEENAGSPYNLRDMNHEKQMLIYKIQQLEARIQTSEQVIRENSKANSKELAALKLEIAKKDAKIRELEGKG